MGLPQCGQNFVPGEISRPQLGQTLMGCLGGGGGGGGRAVGCHTNPRMPPIRPSMKPINKPPAAPNQLNIEKTITITPHVTCCSGLFCIIKAPTIMSMPQTTPNAPTIPPIPPMKKVRMLPTTITMMPPIRMKMPPTSDRAKAAVGFSSLKLFRPGWVWRKVYLSFIAKDFI